MSHCHYQLRKCCSELRMYLGSIRIWMGMGGGEVEKVGVGMGGEVRFIRRLMEGWLRWLGGEVDQARVGDWGLGVDGGSFKLISFSNKKR